MVKLRHRIYNVEKPTLCKAPPALKGPFITPGNISVLLVLKLFIAFAWDEDSDDDNDDDNDVIILLLLLLTALDDTADDNIGGEIEPLPSPLLSNGCVPCGGMEGFPTLFVETELTEVFIDDVILFTNTLLDALLESPDTWFVNEFDWLFVVSETWSNSMLAYELNIK